MTNSAIGIIGAMQEEIDLIHKALTHRNERTYAGITFYEGTWYGQHVVLCRSGVGKVNAAVCTQLLVDRFQADAILFTGVAGALDPELLIGDIVISKDCMQHDMDASPLGFAKGEIPYANLSLFEADASMIKLAADSGQALFPGRIKVGRILSGDQFIANALQVKQLYEEMQGTCTEMEGAAVAQVCVMNAIPFVIIRSMSDKADGTAHENFAQFTVEASNRSYAIVNEMIKNWSSRK